MGCSSCGSGSPGGCGNKGNCNTGGCNKLNTYDWISTLDLYDPSAFNLVEVSFKNGARKEILINHPHTNAVTGDTVVVETDSGLDTGVISLSGELVRTQMKKKKINRDRVSKKVIRRANNRDIEKLQEARAQEKPTLVRARVIARTLGLDMKIGDIEFQGDKRKATFYYTAEGRVDFRELVKSYAREFKIKVEMRQIGARQESARIGGIGSCGRELCCSTWLSDFKSVTTSAARYQNIAINQTKLSGQCGRLKCCLNYELDSYMDALKDFPKNADYIKTKKGKAALIKTDIFKGLMFYTQIEEKFRGPIVALSKERVKEIKAMNAKGEYPEELIDHTVIVEAQPTEEEIKFADVTGEIELPNVKRRRGKRRNSNRPDKSKGNSKTSNNSNTQESKKPEHKKKVQGDNKSDTNKATNKRNNRNKSRRNNRNNKSRNKGDQNNSKKD